MSKLIIPCRNFLWSASRSIHTTAPLLKKVKKGAAHTGKAAAKEAEPDEIVDVKSYLLAAKSKFDQCLVACQKRQNEVKQSTANVKIFDQLKLATGAPFTDVASTSLKGKNALLVSVFNPLDVKKVVSCILASGMNLTPEQMEGEGNQQNLKISLPPRTRESRLQQCKDCKAVFEEYKNSGLKSSLGSVRRTFMSKLKTIKQDDVVKRTEKDLEAMHKAYVNKLHEQFKQAEKSIMA
ncbi:Rrf1p KNAG_0B04790 [Huiozyma naganishii CBS 8797]|uniref:Ribosome-recycling factor, mitochondrial n=1 Tax=Huiozyma naganishii (strain ATCC MYA-139 / BCRC 22969 / CBS 8797 / KCTC 17520 / NBRC 10181 / NCYC 3082 / Yp74L-3) TaxID=1071383 RepID=J7S3U6_HUIN7|nr:hypothetical protein KNAG_0B04790 [Kazachstania naganishii CBS 8797]CCK68914.1 hypothetical protein KNAG_0B04790 [Kazachstania naganishii CBS 8797]